MPPKRNSPQIEILCRVGINHDYARTIKQKKNEKIVKDTSSGSMSKSPSKTTVKSGLWQVLTTPRLLPTAMAHGFIEIPYFIFPTILLLIQKQFNLDDWQIGLIGAGPMLLSGLIAPFAGLLCDRIKKTTLISLTLVLSAFGNVVIGIFGDTLLALIIGIGILGITISFYHPAGFGLISQTELNNRSFMFAIHGIGGTLGASLGPLSVGLLIVRLNYLWQKIYMVWAVPLFGYALFYKMMMHSFKGETTSRAKQKIKSSTLPIIEKTQSISQINQVMTRGLFLLVTFMALLALGRGSLNFFLPAFLFESKGIPIAAAAFFYSSLPLFGIFGQMIGGFVSDKTSEKVIIEVFMILQTVTIILIYFIKMKLVLLGTFCLFGAVSSALWPVTASLTAQSSTERNRGAAYGIYMAPQNILGAIAPTIGGFLKGISYSWLFGFASLLNMSGIVTIHLFSEKTAIVPFHCPSFNRQNNNYSNKL